LLQLILVKKNSTITRHTEEKIEGCQRTGISRKNPGIIQKNSGKLIRQHLGKGSFPLQMPLKDTRLYILQDPMTSSL
jgi:hypothetical protein